MTIRNVVKEELRHNPASSQTSNMLVARENGGVLDPPESVLSLQRYTMYR